MIRFAFQRLSLVLLLMLAMLTAPTHRVDAQTVGTGKSITTLTGIAVDSVRGGYLGGAIVTVRGTARTAMSDTLGRFAIDSVPIGILRLEMLHPFLDTLGLAVVTAPITAVAGKALAVVVAVPSARTIARVKCPATELASGTGALIGIVYSAEDDAPVGDVRIVLAWVDYQIGPKSMVRVPRQRVAMTESDGSFRICGLPDDLSANVVASIGKAETAEVGVNLSQSLAIASLYLPSPDTTLRSRSSLSGRILNPAGTPLANARVSLEGTDAVTITGDDGRFTLDGLPSGTRVVTTRAIGYEPVETAVALRPRSPVDITLKLTRFVIALDTVRITALRNIAMQRIGFDQRSKSRQGTYFGPEDIKKRDPLRLDHLLETLPGLRYINNNSTGKRTVAALRGCLEYIVDGRQWRGDDAPDEWISSQELGAVEYYRAALVPSEFVMASRSGGQCAVVVIWTKWHLRLK